MTLPLHPLESQMYEHEPSQSNTTSGVKKKLTTTNKMVEEALITLHSAKGVTLKQVYNFILTLYNLESLSKIRIAFIKKYIISLRESEDIINTTGRGFSGHFKLVDKVKFKKKISAKNKGKGNSKTTKKSKKSNSRTNATNGMDVATSKSRKVKRINEKTSKGTTKIAPVNAKEKLPNYNASMFDTPLVPTQVHASTPFIKTSFVPQAPEANKKTNRRILPAVNLETPRSSLSKKKRKLLNHPEKV